MTHALNNWRREEEPHNSRYVYALSAKAANSFRFLLFFVIAFMFVLSRSFLRFSSSKSKRNTWAELAKRGQRGGGAAFGAKLSFLSDIFFSRHTELSLEREEQGREL